MPRINLLPWRESERKRKRQEFFLSLGAAIATAGLVVLVGRWQMSASIEHQQERNGILTDEIAKLDKQIEEILGLENQKRKLLARMEIIETLQRSRPEIVHVFDELVRVLARGRLPHLPEADGQPHRDARRGPVEHARVGVHAQHRQLAVAGRPVAAGGREQGRDSRSRIGIHAVRNAAQPGPARRPRRQSEKVAAK